MGAALSGDLGARLARVGQPGGTELASVAECRIPLTPIPSLPQGRGRGVEELGQRSSALQVHLASLRIAWSPQRKQGLSADPRSRCGLRKTPARDREERPLPTLFARRTMG